MKQTHKRKYIKMNEQTSAQIRIPTTTHNRKYKHNQTRNKQNINMIQYNVIAKQYSSKMYIQ